MAEYDPYPGHRYIHLIYQIFFTLNLTTMQQVLQKLNSIAPLSDDLIFYLSQTIKTKDIEEKDFLSKAGHISRNICFIEKGLLRCFYILDNEEKTAWLMKEGDVITSVESFFHQVPSYEFIEAYEDSTIHYITYDDLQFASKKFPEFVDIRLKLTEDYYIESEKRLFLLRGRTGPEKIRYMMDHHADLCARLEQQDLASYLDMTEEHFSKCKPKDLITKIKTKGRKKQKK
jgi:CRP-like cAMP-binding protein